VRTPRGTANPPTVRGDFVGAERILIFMLGPLTRQDCDFSSGRSDIVIGDCSDKILLCQMQKDKKNLKKHDWFFILRCMTLEG